MTAVVFLYVGGGYILGNVVGLKRVGKILLYSLENFTIEVPAKKPNVWKAGHDGPIGGFFAMVVVYQKGKLVL